VALLAERAAWDRIPDLVLPAAGALEALDIGCCTGGAATVADRGQKPLAIRFAADSPVEEGRFEPLVPLTK
jgi:hypothetical protein